MYVQCNVMRFNTLFIIFTVDIKQYPMYMSLKNSLVETFSNNFLKLVNNSSSLNNVNHKCDGVCISDFNWYRCCHFNSLFFLVSVSVEKIGVVVCIVSNIEDHIQSYFPATPQILPNIFRSVFKNCNDLTTFSLVASQLPDADI